VIAVLSSTLWCHRWLSSSSSSDIAVACCLGPLFACCLIAAVSGLGPLSHYCILGLPTSLPKRPSLLGFLYHIVLAGSLARLCPCTVSLLYWVSTSCWLWPIPSMVHSFPRSEFSQRHLSCTMPLLQDGIPSCRQQPTSSRIHSLLGSVPLALHFTLQLYASPCAAPSILRLFSLWHLP
jgi:hypothetical protein